GGLGMSMADRAGFEPSVCESEYRYFKWVRRDCQIDLAHRETCSFEVETKLDRGEIPEHLTQEPLIPARGLRQAIIGDAEGAGLFRRQVFEADDRDFTQPQSPRRIYAAVAGEEVTVLIGQNRNIEAERLDA